MSQSYSKTQYDTFAPNYASMADLPGEKIAGRLLRHGLAEVNVCESKVLDLAGGSGLYARMLVAMGASHVTSIDVSAEMVRIGQDIEAEGAKASRIDFYVADCSAPLDHLKLGRESFDLAMGNWLFNCASSKAELVGMWRNVAEYLKPGGKFVGLMEPLFPLQSPVMRNPIYGLTCTVTGRVEDGVKEHIEVNVRPKVEFDSFVWDQRLYEDAQVETGMTGLRFQAPTVEDLPEGADLDVWKDVLKTPYCILCTAAKSKAK